MKLLIILALAISVSSCTKGGIETTKANDNPEFIVEKLFTHDGCIVYRFSDIGRVRYFVKCGCNNSGVRWEDSCGKNCTEEYDIQTSN